MCLSLSLSQPQTSKTGASFLPALFYQLKRCPIFCLPPVLSLALSLPLSLSVSPMENLRMEHHHGWHLSDPFLHLTSGPASAHLPPLSSASPPADKSGIFSFPLSVLSGPRSNPLSCKSETEESPHLDFVSLSRNRDEPGRNSNEAIAAMKDGLQRLSLNGGNRGGTQRGISCAVGLAMAVKEEQGEGVNLASLEDGGIVLKLGKRIYYEDAGGDEAVKQAENSSSSSKSGSSSSINNNGGLMRKKHRGSSTSNVAPKCLVEGCNADLSGGKDYYRRHKVCERHSKASVSRVAGLEQRFCQQCSRFHVLAEFDEGKRSCRRRLAGHNERRRKPPPEPLPLLSAGTLAYLADSRFNAFLMDHPHLLQQGGAALGFSSGVNLSLASKMCVAGFRPEEAAGSSYKPPEPHHFMRVLPPGRSALGVERALMSGGGDVLSLSSLSGPVSATSPPTSWSISHVPNSQPSSEMGISGCALSLLSSSLGSSSTPCTMSMSLGMNSPLVDQLLADTHNLPLSRQTAPSSSCFSPDLGIVSTLDSLSIECLSSLTNSSSGYSPDIPMPQSPPSFEGASMFPTESDFQTLQSGGSFQRGRPMLDLMQISSSALQQQQATKAGLAIFNRQTMM